MASRAADLSSTLTAASELALQAHQRERGQRRVAALVGPALLGIGAHGRLLLIVHGQDAISERQTARDREIGKRAGALIGDDLEMIGVAANDAAERDHALIGRAGGLGGVERYGRARRQLQRAGNGDGGDVAAELLERVDGALVQKLDDIFVEMRFDDENARAFDGREIIVIGAVGPCHS